MATAELLVELVAEPQEAEPETEVATTGAAPAGAGVCPTRPAASRRLGPGPVGVVAAAAAASGGAAVGAAAAAAAPMGMAMEQAAGMAEDFHW